MTMARSKRRTAVLPKAQRGKTTLALIVVSSALLASCHSKPPETHPSPAQSKWDKTWHWIGDNLKVDGTAGAGYAGIYNGEQFTRAAFNPCSPEPCSGPKLVADSVDVFARNHYIWRPALSTGIVFHLFSAAQSQMGVGIGGHMVFVPDTTGKTTPFPAVTLHVGTPKTEAFFGLILSSTDRVRLPNNAKSVRLSSTATVPDFSQPHCCNSTNLYIGFQVFGTRQNEQNAQAAADSASLTVADFSLAPTDTTVPSGSEFVMRTLIRDAKGQRITRTVQFSSSKVMIAAITPFGGTVSAADTGSTTITAMTGGKSATAVIHVTKP